MLSAQLGLSTGKKASAARRRVTDGSWDPKSATILLKELRYSTGIWQLFNNFARSLIRDVSTSSLADALIWVNIGTKRINNTSASLKIVEELNSQRSLVLSSMFGAQSSLRAGALWVRDGSSGQIKPHPVNIYSDFHLCLIGQAVKAP